MSTSLISTTLPYPSDIRNAEDSLKKLLDYSTEAADPWQLPIILQLTMLAGAQYLSRPSLLAFKFLIPADFLAISIAGRSRHLIG
jgi:hypothetical protein